MIEIEQVRNICCLNVTNKTFANIKDDLILLICYATAWMNITSEAERERDFITVQCAWRQNKIILEFVWKKKFLFDWITIVGEEKGTLLTISYFCIFNKCLPLSVYRFMHAIFISGSMFRPFQQQQKISQEYLSKRGTERSYKKNRF